MFIEVEDQEYHVYSKDYAFKQLGKIDRHSFLTIDKTDKIT